MTHPTMKWALSSALGASIGCVTTLFFVGSGTSPKAEVPKLRQSSEVGRVKAKDLSDAEDLKEPGSDAVAGRLRSLEHRVSLLTAALSRADGGRAIEDSAGRGEDVADPVFEAAVLDIMDREGERKVTEDSKKDELRRQERSQRFAEHLGESLKLDNGLELDSEQKREVSRVVNQYFEDLRALREGEGDRRPVTRAEWRKTMGEITERAEHALMESFTPEQKEKYEALDDDEKLGFGRRSRAQEPKTVPEK